MAEQVNIAILYDTLGWAQHRHALGLQKYVPEWASVDIMGVGEFHGVRREKADVCYCVNFASCRRTAGHALVSCVASHAWVHRVELSNDWRTLGTNVRRNSANGVKILNTLDATVCRNEALAVWARPHCRRVGVFPAGVDCELFTPGDFCEKPAKLRVGWCAQAGTAFKGWEQVMKPLMRDLGRNYIWDCQTQPHATRKPREWMAEWYKTLDVFVCTASAEGTPNPPMEAAASGVPVIATDVGQLRDWETLRELDLIVPDYGSHEEAAITRREIARRLYRFGDSDKRERARGWLLASIDSTYDYRVLAPKTLRFIAGDLYEDG